MTGIFFSSFSRILFFSQAAFFLTIIAFQQEGTAQVFQSAGDGAWNQSATWVSSSNCGADDNLSQGVSPISKDSGCPVEVIVLKDLSVGMLPFLTVIFRLIIMLSYSSVGN